MPPPASRLAVDLSGNSIHVVEGAMGGPMRCGAAAIPDGAAAEGKVSDPAAVARALKPLLARVEVTQTRALVAAGDALGTFRVLRLPSSATTKDVDAAVARELPFDPQQTATRWLEVHATVDGRVIYAAAWDRAQLRNVVEAVRESGLDPAAVELKSASVARVVPAAACVVVDLSCRPAELILVDRHLPRLWHNFAAPDPLGNDGAATLAPPVRSMLRFYRRGSDGEFDRMAPVFVSGEQSIPPRVLDELSSLVEHPARVLPAPPRVPGDVRHSTYLACLGLLMRRER